MPRITPDLFPDLADGWRGHPCGGGRDGVRWAQRRHFTYNIGASTPTAEGFDAEREWVRNLWSALEPWHTSVYVNFLSGGEEGEDRIRAAYGPAKYARLKALKRAYDPENFFHINQNISPGEGFSHS
jgi:hypothetical protein